VRSLSSYGLIKMRTKALGIFVGTARHYFQTLDPVNALLDVLCSVCFGRYAGKEWEWVPKGIGSWYPSL
jgi:hypothetical protein